MRPGDVFAVTSAGFVEYENVVGEPFGDKRIGARRARGRRDRQAGT
jgi:hypothetical protein